MTAKVIGVAALTDRFTRAAALGELAAKGAADVLGTEVAIGARATVAVDTGDTRDSIEYADGHVTVGTPYAADLEYGTSDTPAQPFLRPAADTVSDDSALSHAAQIIGQA